MVVVLGIWISLLFSLQGPVLVISKNLPCNADDLRGLMGLMNSFDSPIEGWWSANSSSLSSFDCCNWVGISCNSTSGRIVKLHLPNNMLSGQLSDSISYLEHLTTLNLSHNFLSDPLPISLFHLSNLEALDLSGNQFLSDLPVSINLPALQVLDISNNYFSGFLPFGLCINSSGIRVLNFSVNSFNGKITSQSGNCRFLEHLSVASNFISGIIPEFLLGLPRLQELALEDNEFTAIGRIGNSSSHLVRLDISSNKFSGNIPDIFYSFPKFRDFSAHSNNLSGTIPPSLSNSQTISSLNLRNNSLDGSIDLNCSMMVNLASLDLSDNNFSGTIPANLASCQNLKALNLARNKLMAGQIPESFKNFHSLSCLSLSSGSFSNLATSLKILQHSPNLTILVLTMNFYGEQLPSDGDFQFKTIKALVISNCSLTGSIPLWLNGLTQLQLLDLSSNHLTGLIPAYFGDFQSLFYLDLSNNSFSGEIPKNLTKLQSMISRDISLEEPSPSFLIYKSRNLISIRWLTSQYNQIMMFPPLLDLSNNFLTGPIWTEFGNLRKLAVLDLKRNMLSGSIPGSLSSLRKLEKLDLSFNSLTGTLPQSLGDLYSLSEFSVAYNNLTGIIPSSGQFQNFSAASFEGNSGLCRQYSPNYCDNMQVLDPTPATSKEDKYSITRLLAFTGFGTGFLVTVFYLLLVPMLIKGYTHN